MKVLSIYGNVSSLGVVAVN